MFLVPKYCWCSKIQLQMTLCLGKLGGLVASTTGNGRETNSLEQVGIYAAMPFKIWKKSLGSNAPNSSNYQIYTRIQLAILEFVHPVHASQHLRWSAASFVPIFRWTKASLLSEFCATESGSNCKLTIPDRSFPSGWLLFAGDALLSVFIFILQNECLGKRDKVLLGYHALCFAISSLMFRLSKGQVALTFNHRSIQARWK